MKTIVKKDLFNVSRRLKKIDSNYFLVYDKDKNRYEVHYKGQRDSTFCFCVNTPLPDATTLKKVYLTMVKNAKKIVLDMVQSNQKLEENRKRAFFDREKDDLKSYLTYADAKSRDVDFSKVDKTRWI